MSRSKILILGSSNTDMLIQVPRIPKPGETILGQNFAMIAGGKGANQAVAAARAGGRVTFMSKVGQDHFGKQILDGLVQEGINVSHVHLDDTYPTGVALIFVGSDGENSIGVASGANAHLGPEHFARLKGSLDDFGLLLMQLEIPMTTIEFAATQAYESKIPIILNPAPACPLPDSLLRKLQIITPNETEAELLTGIKVDTVEAAELAANKLLEMGVQTAIITLGSRGAFVRSRSIRKLVPAFPVKAVDTTAAGDTFNGALAVALAEGRSLEEAIGFANAAAALSVTQIGAKSSIPVRDEIEKLLLLRKAEAVSSY